MPAPADTPRSAPMRRLALMGLVLVAAIISCRDVTGPGGSRFARGLSWNAIFPAPLRDAGVASSGVVNFDRVHVVLHHSDGSVALDTTIDYPSGADSVTVSLAVRLLNNAPASGEPMSLNLGYVNAAGDTVFKGGPIQLTAAPPPAGGGVNPPVQVPVTYSGPGAAAASVVIAPRTQTVVAGGTFAFTAAAKDGTGNTLAGTPVIWTSLDPTIATISKPDSGGGAALTLRGTARILAQLLTGPTDTVQVTVTLPASQIIKPATGSGDAQSATAGTALALPIVTKIAASDAVGVGGTTVTFTVSTGGGSVSPPTAVSDSNGLAHTTWTLGTGAGTQSITVTAASLPNQQQTYTANGAAGVATKLVFASPPTTTAAATPMPIVVYAQDANSNTVTSFTGTVSLALNPLTSGGTLVGTTSTNAILGIAALPVGIAKAFNGYSIVASATGLASATSAAFNITPGAPKLIVPDSGFGQTGIIGTQLANQISVRVIDTVGNGVPGKTVTFGTTAGSGSVTPTSVVTDASGKARTTWTLGPNVSVPNVSYDTATAAVSGLTTLKILAGGFPAVHVWTGASSTSWTDTLNWSPVHTVPAATDSVVIPSTTNNPTISSNAAVRTLITAPNATITINGGDTLTIGGTFANAGGTVGAGALVLSGNGIVGGAVGGSLIVSGNYALGAPTLVSGNVTVTGSLVLGGNQMSVAGLFCTQGAGTLTMTNAADTLAVGGTAKFAGGSTVGLLTNGAIIAFGDVLVPSVATSFAPSANSALVMLGTGGQSITGSVLGTTTLQNFTSANTTGSVSINTLVTIQGNASIFGPVVTGQPLTINGALTDPGVCPIAPTGTRLAASFTLPDQVACLSASSLILNNATAPLSNTFEILSDVMFTGSNVALQLPLIVNGAVTVNNGNLAVNGQQFAVFGAFSTIGTGTLTMNNAADTMAVAGQATFNGGPEAGLLTNGTLGLLQGLVVSGPGQFAASGNHTTYLFGPAYAPLIGCEVSCLDFGQAPRIAAAQATRTTARTSASVAASVPRTGTAPVNGAKKLSPAALAAGLARFAAIRARSATMRTARKAASATWPSRSASVRAARAAGLAARARVGAAGKTAVASPRTTAGLNALATARGAMAARAMTATARAAAAARSATTARVTNFAAPRAPIGAAPMASARVRAGAAFTLPTVSDSAVYVAFADTTGNQLANVHIIGTSNWQTIASVAGNVLVDTSAFVTGNGHLLINDTLFVSGSAEVFPEAVELFGVLSDTGYFSPDTTIYSGTSQTLQSGSFGDVEYENLVVNSPSLSELAEDGSEIDIYGSMFIVNSGQLRIGAPEQNCPSCGGTPIYVDGSFETHGSGTVRMTDTALVDVGVGAILNVGDSAFFAGGSTAGMLTYGGIAFYGNFRQAGDPAAYAATSSHESYFAWTSQTITFANPGYAGNSHFGDVYFAEANETSAVDFYLATNVFADGLLETGCISCEFVHHLHAGTPGATSITSKGASVNNVLFDGVNWDLQDGYPVYNADLVDFENQNPTGTQFSIERTDSLALPESFSSWTFGTPPTNPGPGLYVQVTQTDGGATGVLTADFSNTNLNGNFGFDAVTGGAVINGWPIFAPASEWSSAARRPAARGTSAAPAGTLNGGLLDRLRR